MNNINAKKEKTPGNNVQTSRAASKLSNRTGSSLWGKARAKLGLPAKPSMYVMIFHITNENSINVCPLIKQSYLSFASIYSF